MIRHILVPTDGSSLSTRAAKYAIRLAKSEGARLTVFHAIPEFRPVDSMDGAAAYPELFSAKEYRKATEARSRKMLAKVQKLAQAAKVKCDTAFATGVPWEATIKAAKAHGCDLIVMASHGRRGLEAVILGSETTKVLTHSKVPVLVCR